MEDFIITKRKRESNECKIEPILKKCRFKRY